MQQKFKFNAALSSTIERWLRLSELSLLVDNRKEYLEFLRGSTSDTFSYRLYWTISILKRDKYSRVIVQTRIESWDGLRMKGSFAKDKVFVGVLLCEVFESTLPTTYSVFPAAHSIHLIFQTEQDYKFGRNMEATQKVFETNSCA